MLKHSYMSLREAAGNNKQTDISSLIKVLNHFHPLSLGIVDYFQQRSKAVSFRKGSLLLKAGTICEYIYFIQKGVVRGFITEGKRDITTWITAENELVTSISALDKEEPAYENMEALEDCQLLAVSTKDMYNLYQQFPEFNITGRKLLQQYYRDAESRAFIVRLTNAGHKYKYFIQHYPHLVNRIPLKYIASYLGITLETLSRVRGRMSGKG